MNKQIIAEVCNSLTVPITALERLNNGEEVPEEFLKSALEELLKIPDLLRSADDSE